MKKWTKPTMVTISEEDMKKMIVAGACSYYDEGCDYVYWGR